MRHGATENGATESPARPFGRNQLSHGWNTDKTRMKCRMRLFRRIHEWFYRWLAWLGLRLPRHCRANKRGVSK